MNNNFHKVKLCWDKGSEETYFGVDRIEIVYGDVREDVLTIRELECKDDSKIHLIERRSKHGEE